MENKNPVKEKMIREVGRPFFAVFGIGQGLAIITFICSVLVFIFTGWNEARPWFLGSLFLIFVFYFFYRALWIACERHVKEFTDEWDREANEKTPFQKKLEEIAKENAKRNENN